MVRERQVLRVEESGRETGGDLPLAATRVGCINEAAEAAAANSPVDPFQYDIDSADQGSTIETIRATLPMLPQTSRFAEQAPTLLDTLAERHETNGLKEGKWQDLQRHRGRVTGSPPLVIAGDTVGVVQGKYGGRGCELRRVTGPLC